MSKVLNLGPTETPGNNPDIVVVIFIHSWLCRTVSRESYQETKGRSTLPVSGESLECNRRK